MLKIPYEVAANFLRIAELDTAQIDKLCEALGTVSLSLEQADDIRKTVSTVLSDAGAARNVSDIVQGLHALFASSTQTTNEFVSEIVSAVRENERIGSDLTTPKVEILEANLLRLLSVEKLLIGQKASMLLVEQDKIFSDARIITDLRPVFETDVARPLLAVAISHNLKIEFVEGREGREVYISIDTNDLHKLRNLIDRAIKKDTQLRLTLSQGLRAQIIGPKPPDGEAASG